MTMMNRRHFVFLAAGLIGVAAAGEGDPGKDVLATVTVTVYYGTNGDPAAAGARATEISKDAEKKLTADPKLHFSKYRQLGKDEKPLYRSYENWAQPLRPSDEVLLRFEAQSLLAKDVMRLDLELWLSRKKILKTDAPLSPSKPLLVLGPEWRGGRLILAIELAPATSKP
ncbi:MAG: hypothetical protein JWO82_1917 [Akkermansiaceae bacterium]|nr:hypothetical protein [Akkermansiaceae bacterium]